jgi:hypothetical protein
LSRGEGLADLDSCHEEASHALSVLLVVTVVLLALRQHLEPRVVVLVHVDEKVRDDVDHAALDLGCEVALGQLLLKVGRDTVEVKAPLLVLAHLVPT